MERDKRMFSKLQVLVKALSVNADRGNVQNVEYLRGEIYTEAKKGRDLLNKKRDLLMSRGGQPNEIRPIIQERNFFIEVLGIYEKGSSDYKNILEYTKRNSSIL